MLKKGSLLILAAAVFMFSFSLSGCGQSKKESGPAASSARSAVPAAAKEESLADLMRKGRSVDGFSYDYFMDQTVAQQQIKMTGKTYKSGQKVRNESTVNNQKMIVITDTAAKVIYSYNPDQNTAMKMTFEDKKEMDTPDKYNKEADAAKMKVLETTTYDGVKCKVVLIEENQGETTKMWVREDYGLPMKVEMTNPSGKMTMEFKNINVGSQPATLFELPPGVKVTDMSEMRKNIPAGR